MSCISSAVPCGLRPPHLCDRQPCARQTQPTSSKEEAASRRSSPHMHLSVPAPLRTSHSHLTLHTSLPLSQQAILTSHFPLPYQSQRDCVPQPRVGLRHDGLPWVPPTLTHNPNGVASPNPCSTGSRTTARPTLPHNSTSIPIMNRSLLCTIRHLRPHQSYSSNLAPSSSFSLLTSPFLHGAIAGLVQPQGHWRARSSRRCGCSHLIHLPVLG